MSDSYINLLQCHTSYFNKVFSKSFFKNIIYPNEGINIKKPKVRAFIREVEDDFKAKQSENPKPKVRQTVWVLIGSDYLSLKNPYGDVVLIDGEKTIKRSR